VVNEVTFVILATLFNKGTTITTNSVTLHAIKVTLTGLVTSCMRTVLKGATEAILRGNIEVMEI
jgi:hypothetical protein